MATKEERDKRLDDLLKATQDWAKRQKEILNAQSELIDKILEGRGTENIAKTTSEKVSSITVEEINNFLTG